MINKILRMIFGSANDRMLRQFKKRLPEIESWEPILKEFSDEELRNKTNTFRERLRNGETKDDILPEAFAVVREASRRVLGMRHFDVQMIGGMVLHKGMVAEMRTGEGKTLVATLPAYLNALAGKGVHVITVNDYLANRDSQTMGPLYNFLGLSVGCIVHGIPDHVRQQQYAADVTYGTNNEFGFDYLRDNMKHNVGELCQRELHYCIIDEADSILIDESRTPLIISGASEESTDLYEKVDHIIPHLKVGEHYEKDEKGRQVNITEEGSIRIEELLQQEGLITEGSLYDYQNLRLMHYVNQALKAHVVFDKDKDYIVKDNKVMIIDEFTGRIMEGRRYSDGLHQALEAKEKVEIQSENQTLASITFQNFFRLYHKCSGMTGTAMTEAAEFQDIYKLDVVAIPPNVPCKRIDYDDEVYRTNREKYVAVIKLIEECIARKQPVLVGTGSIERSEHIAELLKERKIAHQVLNAKYHDKEAIIIADAGRPGAVTIATNMAGRGTDIKLGGNLEKRLAEELANVENPADIEIISRKIQAEIAHNAEIAKDAGGLFVIGTERHESRRIDNQLRGRSGRQGDPGASKFFISLEDDLIRIFGASERLDSMLTKMGLQEGEALTHKMINRAIANAQSRVERRNYDIRKQLLKYDDVMNDQRKIIYEQRKTILNSSDVSDMILGFLDDTVDAYVNTFIPKGSYEDEWNIEGLKGNIQKTYGLDVNVDSLVQGNQVDNEEIVKSIVNEAEDILAKKETQYGAELMRHLEKTTLLRIFDQVWKSHLLDLDHIRQGVNWRSYANKDPLTEYKKEAFNLFNLMLDHLKVRVIEAMCHLDLNVAMTQDLADQYEGDILDEVLADKLGFKHHEFFQQDTVWDEVPRNADCPCGSGKKYKHCCGKFDE